MIGVEKGLQEEYFIQDVYLVPFDVSDTSNEN